MRNQVARHDFNRASAHKSLKDYTRVSQQEIMEENWDVNEFGTDKYPTKAEEWEDFGEDELPIKDPKQWESTHI